MRNYQARRHQLYRTIAPMMILPVLTLITGSLYQIVDLGEKGFFL